MTIETIYNMDNSETTLSEKNLKVLWYSTTSKMFNAGKNWKAIVLEWKR